jgi:hypothetical protein
MTAMISRNNDSREQLEKDALRLLCSDLIPAATRVRLSGQLANYEFCRDLTRVVYEEIALLGEVPAWRLRELLPARMTNRGFPDFELNQFLGRREGMHDEIEKSYESLLELIEEHPTRRKKALGQSA